MAVVTFRTLGYSGTINDSFSFKSFHLSFGQLSSFSLVSLIVYALNQ
jgi:hypothetical protein